MLPDLNAGTALGAAAGLVLASRRTDHWLTALGYTVVLALASGSIYRVVRDRGGLS